MESARALAHAHGLCAPPPPPHASGGGATCLHVVTRRHLLHPHALPITARRGVAWPGPMHACMQVAVVDPAAPGLSPAEIELEMEEAEAMAAMPSRRQTKRYNYDLSDKRLEPSVQAESMIMVGAGQCVRACMHAWSWSCERGAGQASSSSACMRGACLSGVFALPAHPLWGLRAHAPAVRWATACGRPDSCLPARLPALHGWWPHDADALATRVLRCAACVMAMVRCRAA